MNLVDELRKSRESQNVAYQTFAKHIREDKDGLFCFFEGKDSPYYHLRIKQVFPGNYFPIKCGNKKKVKGVFELIDYHRIYDEYKKAFFIDSDFDPPFSEPRIYETPCYSVENHYTSVEVFKEIIKSEWGLSEVDDAYKHCVALYKDLQTQFHTAMHLFNAWYACLIDKKHELKKEVEGVNLDNKPPKGFITIRLEGVTSNYDLTKIRAQYPKAFTITDEEISTKLELFDNCDKRLVFRGKYELHFMVKIFELLVADSKPRGERKHVSQTINGFQVNHTNAISLLSQYAETPPELTQYIQNCIN